MTRYSQGCDVCSFCIVAGMQLIRAMQEAIAEEQKPVEVFTGEMVFAAQESPTDTTGDAVIEGCCF